MHPSFADVRHWFAADAITDNQLASYLWRLGDAPHWQVGDSSDSAVRTLHLTYVPTGTHIAVVLERRAGWWRSRAP